LRDSGAVYKCTDYYYYYYDILSISWYIAYIDIFVIISYWQFTYRFFWYNDSISVQVKYR